ncbi:MAG: outer membrane beta-barrel protein [Bacteroidetes bacterium]|nr:outer membrane beta-barrel protein [Bacteroidota bacterium]
MFFAFASKAQNGLQMDIAYRVDIPTGSFTNQVSNASAKGFNAALSYSFNTKFSLGLMVSYNDYYQKYPRALYTDAHGSTISAVMTNSIQQTPIQVVADYKLIDKGIIQPYVGLGAGFNLVSYDQYLGEFDNPQNAFKPTFSGDAGIFIPVSRISSTAIRIGAGYNFTPLNMGGIKNLNTFDIHAGVRFPFN